MRVIYLKKKITWKRNNCLCYNLTNVQSTTETQEVFFPLNSTN